MMSYEQFLLTKTAEEAVEVAELATELARIANRVAKRSLKAQQFGLDEVQKDYASCNAERLREELKDLHAVAGMLSHQTGFDFLHFSHKEVVEKQSKVEKYLNYSRQLNKVE